MVKVKDEFLEKRFSRRILSKKISLSEKIKTENAFEIKKCQKAKKNQKAEL